MIQKYLIFLVMLSACGRPSDIQVIPPDRDTDLTVPPPLLTMKGEFGAESLQGEVQLTSRLLTLDGKLTRVWVTPNPIQFSQDKLDALNLEFSKIPGKELALESLILRSSLKCPPNPEACMGPDNPQSGLSFRVLEPSHPSQFTVRVENFKGLAEAVTKVQQGGMPLPLYMAIRSPNLNVLFTMNHVINELSLLFWHK